MIKIKTTADKLVYMNRFISKEATRFYLQGVYFEPEGLKLISTDGHRLGIYDDAFTVSEEIEGEFNGLIIKFNKEFLSELKSMKNREITLTIKDKDIMSIDAPVVIDGSFNEVGIVINADYPHWQNVIPDESKPTPMTEIGINPDFLKDFKPDKKHYGIKLEFFTNKNGIGYAPIKVSVIDMPEFTGYVMPVRY